MAMAWRRRALGGLVVAAVAATLVGARIGGGWAGGAAQRQRRPTVLVSGEDAREVAAGEALLRREEAKDAAGTLANGIEEVERTKRLLAARGRLLAQRIAALRGAVREEVVQLARHGVPAAQLSDMREDTRDIQAALASVAKLAKLKHWRVKAPVPAPLPSKVRAKQKRLLDRALKLADKAVADDKSSTAKRRAAAREDKAYRHALAAAAQAHRALNRKQEQLNEQRHALQLLNEEKALLKAHEHREARQRRARAQKQEKDHAMAVTQHDIDAAIAAAEKAAKADLSRQARQGAAAAVARVAPASPGSGTVLTWAGAATAAERGDMHTVKAFCQSQSESTGCMTALTAHEHHARGLGSASGQNKRGAAQGRVHLPCDPQKPGYFKCLGIHSTGGTLG